MSLILRSRPFGLLQNFAVGLVEVAVQRRGRRMLTRWGSILKVTHSVVTMGRTRGRRPVNGIPHSSPLARKGFGSPPMRTLNGHWRWSGAVRAADRARLVCDIQLRECRWFFLTSFQFHPRLYLISGPRLDWMHQCEWTVVSRKSPIFPPFPEFKTSGSRGR